MTFIKMELHQLTFDALLEVSKEDKYVIKDFGYEILISKNYIHQEQDYLGACLKEIDNKFYIICKIK